MRIRSRPAKWVDEECAQVFESGGDITSKITPCGNRRDRRRREHANESEFTTCKHTCNKCSFNIINEYRTRMIWQQREQAEQPRWNENAREARAKRNKKDNNSRRDSAVLRETKQKPQQQRKRMKRRVENYWSVLFLTWHGIFNAVRHHGARTVCEPFCRCGGGSISHQNVHSGDYYFSFACALFPKAAQLHSQTAF